jgi:hypothetical protein
MRFQKLSGWTAILALASVLFAAVPAQANLIVNGGFEQTQYSAGYYAYPNGTLDGWTYNGSAILNASGASAWYIGSGPSGFEGDQYMALQGTSSLSQGFNSDGGTFELSFLDAGRSGFGPYNGDQTFQVWIDSTLIGTFSTVSNSNFVLQIINGIVLTSGYHTLTFLGIDPLGGDETAFLDDINLTQVPEPSTIALFGAALLAFGAFYRRRQQVR